MHRARLDTAGTLTIRLAHLGQCRGSTVATNRDHDGVLVSCPLCGASVTIQLEEDQ